MQLMQSCVLPYQVAIPFDQVINRWANQGDDYLIQYDETSRTFNIPHASENDFYITWKITLKTALLTNYPMMSLEYKYNNVIRDDDMIFPITTGNITGSSLYHVTGNSQNDVLSVQLIPIDNPGESYTLLSDAPTNYSANIIIIGL